MAGPSRNRVSEAAWTLPRLGSDPNPSLSQLVGPTTSKRYLLQAACQNVETCVLFGVGTGDKNRDSIRASVFSGPGHLTGHPAFRDRDPLLFLTGKLYQDRGIGPR